jgi:glycosyltransferase involved in cell wall biosynthesis
MKKVTVLHVLSSISFSGAENVACQIITMTNGECSSIYCSPNGQIKETLKEKAIPYMPLKKLSFWELRKVVREVHPTIIHAHDVKASVLSALSIPTRIKIVSHMHVNNTDMRKHSFKAIIYSLVAHRFSKIIWVSKSAFEDYVYKNHVYKNSIILTNIIDTEYVIRRANLSIQPISYDIVSIGRLTYQKNPQKLFQILKSIAQIRPSIRACIIGDGVFFNEIKKNIVDNHLEKNISMFGFVENPLPYLKNSKLLVLTSRFEGTPMVALEAMTLGIPIVSTPTDGMIDLVEDGKTGFLQDNDDLFVRNIIMILDNDQFQRVLSNLTKKRIQERNDETGYKKAIIDIYSIL